MRKRLIACAVSAAFWTTSAQAQGVPVIDITAVTNLYAQYAQEVKDAAVQLQQLEQAAQAVGWATNTFNSLVANPNLANSLSLLNAVGVPNPLPVSPYAIQGLISGQGGIRGDLGALGSLANSAAATNNVYTCTDTTFVCQNSRATATSVAGAQGIAQQIGQSIAAHFPVINALKLDMMTATTPAEREHVANQIAAEQVWTQETQGQLQMASLMLAAERDNRQQRNDEQSDKSIDGQLAQAKAEGILN